MEEEEHDALGVKRAETKSGSTEDTVLKICICKITALEKIQCTHTERLAGIPRHQFMHINRHGRITHLTRKELRGMRNIKL